MKKIKAHIIDHLDILFFVTVISLKVIAYGVLVSGGFINSLLVIYPAIISVITFCSISILFNEKTRGRILYAFNIIISSMLLADIIYFGYFRDILSIPVIQNGMLLGPVKSSVSSLFKPIYLLFFIDIFITPHLFYNKISSTKKPISHRIIAFALLLLIGGGLNGLNIYMLSVQQPKLISTMYNRIYIAKNLGNLNFHALDFYNFVHNEIYKNQLLSEEKENEIQTFLTAKSEEKLSPILKGSYKGKNLIIIQVEALQQFVINRSIEGKEITPNLNKLISKSLYFDNYFYQVGAGNTSDAEFMTNNSLYPAAQGATCYLYSGNDYNSLPKALNNIGYSTSTFHGYKEGFWNRNVMNKAEGFNKFYGETSFDVDDTVGLGLSDKSFFNQSFEKLKEIPEPYYSFLITLSSHFPFNDVNKYGDLNVGEYKDTFLGNYFKSIHYADAQIGMFINKLEKEGITDKSVIAIYGDHYAIPKKEETDLNKFLNIKSSNELSWTQLQKVPLIIHFPKDEHKNVNHIYSGEMDLYPTIANLYDLPKKDLMGTDLLNAKKGNVILRNGSFTDGDIFYISSSNTYYNISTGEKMEENDKLKDKKNRANSQLEYSDAILNHNLLKKFTIDSK